jgi:hypothetical protein
MAAQGGRGRSPSTAGSPLERRRSSIGHELGHWHHHKGRMLICMRRRPSSMCPTHLSNGTPAAVDSARMLGTSAAMPTPRISAPLGDLIKGRDLMREQHRIVQRRQQHRGADLNSLEPRRNYRHQGERLVAAQTNPRLRWRRSRAAPPAPRNRARVPSRVRPP